jgi:hypothetical protein
MPDEGNGVMAYLLRPALEPGGAAGLIFSTGPDDLSCQAEILALFRKANDKRDPPKGQIVCTWKIEKDCSSEKWISGFSADDRNRILAAKADILASSWATFHKGLIPMPKGVGGYVMGREIPKEYGIVSKDETLDTSKSTSDILKEALTNPLHAGIHPEFKATVPEELWIKSATLSVKSMGAEKWLTGMIETLRSYFGGSPKAQLPHKNDVCFCKSGKKYGKCCGEGVQEEDPEDCKLGRHDFEDGWAKSPSGKFIRGCTVCMKIEEAPYGEEVDLPSGPKGILIGCKTCRTAPTIEDAERLLASFRSSFGCSFCGKPIEIKNVTVTHPFDKDGVHQADWKIMSLTGDAEFSTLRVRDARPTAMSYIIHERCMKTAFPHADQYSKVTSDDDDRMRVSTEKP